MGMSKMLKFCLRIKYSSKSNGPSKASRKTLSASGGMYRSWGSANKGSPYRRAKATWSMTTGMTGVGLSGWAGRALEASKSGLTVAAYWLLGWPLVW
jgi:hypothetical protein